MTELYDPITLQTQCADNEPSSLIPCTEYMKDLQVAFDGDYYVMKIPADFKVFNGTEAHEAMLFYPYSNTKLTEVAEKGYDSLDFDDVGPSWFGPYNVSQIYSKGKRCEKCIYVFVIAKDVTVLVLSNAYNLMKLALVSEEMSSLLCKMYTIEELLSIVRLEIELGKELTQELVVSCMTKLSRPITRNNSYKEVDYDFAIKLKQYIQEKYAGYMTPKIRRSDRDLSFHEEIVIFNPTESMTRDYYSDLRDVYNDYEMNGSKSKNLRKHINLLNQSGEIQELGGTQWSHTVWTLLYTEKILEYYQRPSYLDLSPRDSKFIAFVALIYKADDETIREIALDYDVDLNDDRISIIKLVQDRHRQFEDIVNIVSKDIKKYINIVQFKYDKMIDFDTHHCDDYISPYDIDCKKFKYRDKIYVTYKPLNKLLEVYKRMNHLEASTLLIISIASVIGMQPFGKHRLDEYNRLHILKFLNASSKYFPIANEYQTTRGSKDRSDLMKKLGMFIGHILFTKS